MTIDNVLNGPWEKANRDQGQASQPGTSVWVSANAGSGKTHVLVNRIIRLMLAGVPPERILCLTYTRAAAAEMSRRLFDVLSSWIPLDDETLIGEIHTLSGYATFGGELKAARRLFARALETPGGLKIQTIHAFCERLLQRFPVEAGVVPGFAVMDEIEARELLAEARRAVLSQSDGSAEETGAALATVVAFAGEQQLDALVKELLSKRSELRRLLSDPEVRQQAMLALTRFLGLDPEECQEAIWAMAWDGMDRDYYAAAGTVLDGCGGKVDPSQGALIASALAAASAEQAFAALKRLFLTQQGQPKAEKSLCTAATAARHPEICDFLRAERDRIAGLADKECAVKIRDASTALFRLADAIIGRYEAEKRRLGRYDYDDLIGRTLSLFVNAEYAAWVLYKLDGGLDHILIDEAQDTSPEQWRIVQYLVEEFFAGEGQRPACRTLFAVGDRKQSIFSFQGADPDGFDAMRRHFQAKARDAQLSFATVRPTVSFRSTQTVLDAVDAVFAAAAACDGVKEQGEDAIVHHAVREGEPGLVEIWEPETPDPAGPASPWQAGSARDPAEHPRRMLARRIAATIRGWLDNGETLAASGQPIRPGDILILVRSRTTFMDALVRALKQAGIAVAGADRLVLTQHIAIQDLLALARFTLLPDDDLTLATVLKSPLVARDGGAPFDDDDLFRLAWQRSGSLWTELHKAVADGALYGGALERLKRWRAASDFMPPYEFFAQVLTGDGGRRAIMNRLGAEASEPLDAFLAFALDFAPGQAASLQAFLAAVEESDAEIKRDMDHGADEVRVMTVHGAKGLEAPVVFLPDTCEGPSGRHDPAILVAGDAADGEAVPLWRLKSAVQTAPVEALRQAHQQRARQEYNRLLYVAMTRARDRLYVCGCQTTRELKQHCWYDLIASALRPQAQEVRLADGRTAWRIEGTADKVAAEPEAALEPPLVAVEPPAWADRPPQCEPPAMRWLVASRLAPDGAGRQAIGGEAVMSPLAGLDEHRFRRGRLVHRLLQALPDRPEAERRAVAERYLAHAAGDLDATTRETIADEVLAVLDHPSLRPLFAPGSLAEVPLAAVLGTDAQRFGLTGQIDRLAVIGDEVLIADYKTNRPPPAAPVDADPQYIRQLAAYRAALARLYPGRTIRCALVWTEGPRLMEIPSALLDAALPLARVTLV